MFEEAFWREVGLEKLLTGEVETAERRGGEWITRRSRAVQAPDRGDGESS